MEEVIDVDISKLFATINSIPKEKLRSDSGLKEVFRDIGKKAGKNFTDQELNNFVSRFRNMYRTESAGSMMSRLAKKGVNSSELKNLKNGFKK